MNNEESQLKNLAIKFQGSGDPHVFWRILQRMDGLLRSIIYNARRKKPQLRKIEGQNLYSSALVGLYKAVLKVKEDEPESILVPKIIFYANREINFWAIKPREKSFSSSFIEDNIEEWPPWAKGVWSGGCVKQFYDEPVYENLEREFIQDRFRKLIEEGVLREDDFKILVMRVVEGMTYPDIAKKIGDSHHSVIKRVERTLNKLRKEFRKRGWGDDI